MPPNYLHGVETLRITTGPRPVRLVKSAVTGAIVLAPQGPVNEPTLILSDADASQFGPDLWNAGFTAAATFAANFAEGRPSAGAVIAINVLDPAVHKSTATNETVTFDAATGKACLAHPAVSALTLQNATGAVTYVSGTDYTLDAVTGTLTRLAGGAIAAGASVKASTYDYLDPTLVTAADVIGATSLGGIRSGLQAFLDCFQLFGYFPKRLVAANFSSLATVTAAMLTLANRIRARAYIDAPVGITPAQAITGRGPAGTINFNVNDKRAILFYPHVKVLDTSAELWDNGNTLWDGTSPERLEPLSIHAAGLGNAVDIEKGYWWSASNNTLNAITGLERTVTWMWNDPATEANALNEAGIVTVGNNYGTGFLLWGNRSAAWPTDTTPENFECVTAVGDIIDESIEYFTLKLLDQPINDAWLDTVTESVNGFMRKLIGDGAILDGRCWYDPGDNPPTELAQGHVVFRRDFLPPLPAERITYKVRINIDYLKSLGTQQG
jgi:phage tail sheath protein FI